MAKIQSLFLSIFTVFVSICVCDSGASNQPQPQRQNQNQNPNPNTNAGETKNQERFQVQFEEKMKELEQFKTDFKEFKFALVELTSAFVHFHHTLTKNEPQENPNYGSKPIKTPLPPPQPAKQTVKIQGNGTGTGAGSTNQREKTVNVNRPGQNWIVVHNISQSEPNGHWENSPVCPPSKVVTGHKFKYLLENGLTGIQLMCTEKFGQDEGESDDDDVHVLRISSEDESEINGNGGIGEWTSWTRGQQLQFHTSFAHGFSFAQGGINSSRSAQNSNYEFIYHIVNQNQTGISQPKHPDSGRVEIKCPDDHAICGLSAMMDEDGLGVLTAIKLKCCFHCIPEEKWVTIHQQNNSKRSDEKKEVNTTVGLKWTSQKVHEQSNGNRTDFAGLSHFELREAFSSLLEKSNGTKFDWTRTRLSIWTGEKSVKETYTCTARSSCVLKQLVGQCGRVRVPIDKFCLVSVPMGTSSGIPESCNLNLTV